MKLNCPSLNCASIQKQLGDMPNRAVETGKLMSRKVTPHIPNICGGIAVSVVAAITSCMSGDKTLDKAMEDMEIKCMAKVGLLTAAVTFAFSLAIIKFVIPKFTANGSTTPQDAEIEGMKKKDIEVALVEIEENPTTAENAVAAAGITASVEETTEEVSDTEAHEHTVTEVVNTEPTEQITVIAANTAEEGVVITPIEQDDASQDDASIVAASEASVVAEDTSSPKTVW